MPPLPASLETPVLPSGAVVMVAMKCSHQLLAQLGAVMISGARFVCSLFQLLLAFLEIQIQMQDGCIGSIACVDVCASVMHREEVSLTCTIGSAWILISVSTFAWCACAWSRLALA